MTNRGNAEPRQPVISRTGPESERRPSSPEQAKRNRSTAMVVLGLLLFLVAGMGVSNGAAAGLLFGLLAVGLIVGGLVIRP